MDLFTIWLRAALRHTPGRCAAVIFFMLHCCKLAVIAPAWAAPAAKAPPAVQITGAIFEPAQHLLWACGLSAQKLPTAEQEAHAVALLDELGYTIAIKRGPRQVTFVLQPAPTIRSIYVKGNWPIPEEEILRRLAVRPGQRLPQGITLIRWLQRYKERIAQLMGRQGYFDSEIEIAVSKPDAKGHVNLSVHLKKGQSYKIQTVQVTHLRSARRIADASTRPPDFAPALSQEQIAKHFEHRLLFYRYNFNTEKFKDDVEKLVTKYKDLGYPGIRIKDSYDVQRTATQQGVVVQLNVQQRKRIVVSYEGNTAIPARELKDALTLNDSGTYDEYELQQSARQIRKLYQSEGYLQAKVDFRRRIGTTQDEVVFVVDQGPRFRIKYVSMSRTGAPKGTLSFSRDEILKHVHTKPFAWYGYLGLGSGGYVTEGQLQQDAQRIKNFYIEKGFVGTRVWPSVKTKTFGSTGQAFVHFSIDEGTAQRIVDVTIEYAVIRSANATAAPKPNIPEKDLRALLQLKPSAPFNEQKLEQDKISIVRHFAENGYPGATVQAFEQTGGTASDNGTGSEVDVQFTIRPGPFVRFGQIFLRGNHHSRDSVIRKALGFHAGDPFDIRKLEQAEKILQSLKIFDGIRIKPLSYQPGQTSVPILVRVEERYDDWGAIEFVAGGSTDNPFFGAVAYNWDNVFGFSTRLNIRAELGLRLRHITGIYIDPRLLNYNVKMETQGYFRSQQTLALGTVDTYGGSIAVTKELLARLFGTLKYEFRQIQRNEPLYRPEELPFDESEVNVPTRTGSIGPELLLDHRDNPLDPQRGFLIGTSLSWASPYLGGTDSFLKFRANGQVFIPLPLSLRIAIGVRYDHGIPISDSIAIPKVERFFAGGDTTIRGYEEDSAFAERVAIPVSPYSDLDDNNIVTYRIVPLGGNIRLLGNAELQFPIWRESIILSRDIMGAIFIDSGAVFNSFDHLNWQSFRHGAGLALRVILPVGFASFEYAFAIQPGIGDSRNGRFHFNFGLIF